MQTAVEAVNDGKIASWEMHRYLQVDNDIRIRTDHKKSLGLAWLPSL